MKRYLKLTALSFIALTACKKVDNSTKSPAPLTLPSPVSGTVSFINSHSELDHLTLDEVTDSIRYTSGGLIDYISCPKENNTLIKSLYSGTNIVRVNRTYTTNSGYDSLFYTASTLDSVRGYDKNNTATLFTAISYSGSKIAMKEIFMGKDRSTKFSKRYTYDPSGNLKKLESLGNTGHLDNYFDFYYGSDVSKLHASTVFNTIGNIRSWSGIFDAITYSQNLPDSVEYSEYNGTGYTKKIYSITYDLSSNGYPVEVYSNKNKVVTFGY